MDDDTTAALTAIISNLARGASSRQDAHPSRPQESNGFPIHRIVLPGPASAAKSTLEKEIAALALRVEQLETCGTHDHLLPLTPGASFDPLPLGTRDSASEETKATIVDNLLTNNGNHTTADHGESVRLTDEQLTTIREHVNKQAEQIESQKNFIDVVSAQLKQQQGQTERALGGLEHESQNINLLKREFVKHQQANLAFQKALREIGNIVTAVANGDLSRKVSIHEQELDPEIATFKKTINKMVDQLQDFASQVTHLAKEVGTEGRLGGQAAVPGVSGIWRELQDNVNFMAENLTHQVREIAVVTTAVAHGDLSRKIESPAKGEILQLQQTINTMVDQLRTFATEVTRVAKSVGTEGVLGGQAQIEGVQGTWLSLQTHVNAMADNLTTQVRDIAMVTTAVARGDLGQKVSATCKGEILELKVTINDMVDRLRTFAFEVSKVAREVGTEGRLGGQATVHGAEGTWGALRDDVNIMANNLTTQVREIAAVTLAVAEGDLSKKVHADVRGEILALKVTINSMVDRLSTFAFEVSKVAREVGTGKSHISLLDIQPV